MGSKHLGRSAFLRLFGRRVFQRLWTAVLEVAIRALGYENSASLTVSGEEWFIEKNLYLKHGTVLDIGASNGAYTRLVLKHTSSDVICFEPLEEEIPSLEAIRELSEGRVEVVQCALGDENDERPIYRNKTQPELSSLLPEIDRLDYFTPEDCFQELVTVRSLDSFWESTRGWNQSHEIALVKIDVEGHELAVLRGAARFLDQFQPHFIQIETNRHGLFSKTSLFQISQLLTGYSCHQILPYRAGLIRRDPASSLANHYRFGNFVFVRDAEH